MIKKNKAMTTEVYTSTGLSDLVASPVFYSVLVLTIILGLFSAFGFFQNPHKLKAVVDIISKKVSLSQHTSRVVNQSEYLISHDLVAKDVLGEATISYIDTDRYSIFADTSYGLEKVINHKDAIKPVSFEYDITSRQFWGDLDMSRIESALEESQRKNSESQMTGTPFDSSVPADNDASKYSIKADRFFSL